MFTYRIIVLHSNFKVTTTSCDAPSACRQANKTVLRQLPVWHCARHSQLWQLQLCTKQLGVTTATASVAHCARYDGTRNKNTSTHCTVMVCAHLHPAPLAGNRDTHAIVCAHNCKLRQCSAPCVRFAHAEQQRCYADARPALSCLAVHGDDVRLALGKKVLSIPACAIWRCD